jgi:branched-chain amino acid transport system substrate-binding protein
MSKRPLLPFLITIVLLAFPLHAAKRRAVTVQHTIIRIGGLFSLTGDGASLGAASAAALDLAVRDINQELDVLGTPYRVVSDVVDTKLTAGVAVQKIQEVYDRGARIVIGPQSSAEAGAILPFANEHSMVIISQGSTASTLAIPDDALFRLAPNDKLEGAAQAALFHADAIETIVPIWRDDAGNRGLHDSTSAAFAILGGTVLPGVSYTTGTADFSTQVAALGAAVRGERNAHPNAKIAIYIASFEEAADIIRLARLDSDLSAVRWYGGDGVAQSRALIDDASVAAFAVQTSFTAPNVGLDPAARDVWQPLSDQIKAAIGFAPDAYALSVYDAAWVAVMSAIEVSNDVSKLQASFSRNVQRYSGATGSTALDAAGDRKIGNFDFWTVEKVDGVTEWLRTAQFSGGRVIR